ncbi:hypothetical protein [Actinoalloteichus hoggarensis]|nr:hypothetical protein [Actinoalloteichus hoggarensis]
MIDGLVRHLLDRLACHVLTGRPDLAADSQVWSEAFVSASR